MSFTWLVLWVVVTVYQVPCPGYNNGNREKYGLENNPSVSCAVLHAKTRMEDHSREFKTKDEAIEFIDGMPKSSSGLGSHITSVEILRQDSPPK